MTTNAPGLPPSVSPHVQHWQLAPPNYQWSVKPETEMQAGEDRCVPASSPLPRMWLLFYPPFAYIISTSDSESTSSPGVIQALGRPADPHIRSRTPTVLPGHEFHKVEIGCWRGNDNDEQTQGSHENHLFCDVSDGDISPKLDMCCRSRFISLRPALFLSRQTVV